MNNALLGLPSWKRNIVMVLSNHAKLHLSTTDEGRTILSNQEVLVVSEDEIDSFVAGATIMGASKPAPGLIFGMSMYDENTYYEVSGIRNLVSLEKMAATVRLCQLLGAKKISNELLRIVDRKTNQEISADLRKGIVKGDLKVKLGDLEQLKNKLRLEYELRGSRANAELAREFMKRQHLDTDPHLKYLVEIVAGPGSADNTPQRLEQEICLSDSSENALNIAGKMKLGVVALKMDYGKICTEKTEVLVRLSIEF